MATVPVTSQSIPGPRGLPLLSWRANIVALFTRPFEYLRHLHDTYGDVVALAAGDPSQVIVFGPELNLYVHSHPDLFLMKKTSFYRLPKGSSMERLVSNNLLLMDGEHHMQQRRLMLPALHKKQFVHYHDGIVRLTQQMLDRWQPQTEIELGREMQQLTQYIVIQTLFGLSNETELLHIDQIFQRIIANPFLQIIAPINFAGTPYARAVQAAEQLENLVHVMIAQKRSQPEATDVLAALVQAHDEDGTRLSDDELVAHTYTMFAAGNINTWRTLDWTLFLLNQYPRISTDLLNELDDVLHGEAPTLEQLSHLPLLDSVVKESLRLLPPNGFNYRSTAAPCEVGGFSLPKGATVFFSAFITHHLPELYEEPERFKPERWLTLNRTAYEYLPFSAGHHHCIAAEFALFETKVILAMLFQRYRLALRPNAKIDVDLSMRPTHGMPMRVFPQDRRFEPVSVRGNIHHLMEFPSRDLSG